MQIVMHELKNFIVAFTSIAEHFPNFEKRKTLVQALDPRNGEQMVVAVSRGAGTRQRPDQEETIIHNIEGFGFVAEVVFPAGLAVGGSLASPALPLRCASGTLVRTGARVFGVLGLGPGWLEPA